MPTREHKRAEELAAHADVARKEGRSADAQALYRSAADAERIAVSAFLNAQKTRTFSILAVSHASLLYKARALDLAAQAVYFYLAQDVLTTRGRGQLRELLEVIWDEQLVLTKGYEYSGEEIWIALRGGEVGAGTAPIDTALHYMGTTSHLVSRSTEWTARFPLRRRGLPNAVVREALQARATQPTTGSYRFSVRLLKRQGELFPDQSPASRIDPAAIASFVVEFLQSATRGGVDEVKTVVPDPEYRRALLQLARNILPADTRRVAEIEVSRFVRGRIESALLVEPMRQRLNAAIREVQPSQAPAGGRDFAEIQGTLRAIHLDDNWLLVKPDNGPAQRCETREDVLDDVVGPMVNKRVRITGYWKDVRGGLQFHLDDIDLA